MRSINFCDKKSNFPSLRPSIGPASPPEATPTPLQIFLYLKFNKQWQCYSIMDIIKMRTSKHWDLSRNCIQFLSPPHQHHNKTSLLLTLSTSFRSKIVKYITLKIRIFLCFLPTICKLRAAMLQILNTFVNVMQGNIETQVQYTWNKMIQQGTSFWWTGSMHENETGKTFHHCWWYLSININAVLHMHSRIIIVWVWSYAMRDLAKLVSWYILCSK